MRRFVREYSGAYPYAGMLAFGLFTAMLPLSLGVLTFWGMLSRSPQRFLVAKDLVVGVFPASTQGVLRQVVLGTGEHVGAVGVLSLISLLWFSTGVFTTAGFALNRIYGLPDRPVVRQRLLGLWLSPSLIGATYLAVACILLIRRWSVPGVAEGVVAWVIVAWLVLFLYRLAPSRGMSRAETVPGAALAAAGIVGLAYVFPLYTELTAYLNSGTRFFTVVFGLVAWMYGIAHAILAGAVFNRVHLTAAAPAAKAADAPLEPAGDQGVEAV